MITYKQLVEQIQRPQKRKVSRSRFGGEEFVFSLKEDEYGIEISFRFNEEMVFLNSRKKKKDVFIPMCEISFRVNKNAEKKIDADRSLLRDMVLKGTEIFDQALNDVEVKKKISDDSDVIKLSGDTKWKHHTYDKFAKQLSSMFKVNKVDKTRINTTVMTVLILNEDVLED